MPAQEYCFTSFKEPIDSYALPERFTFPFYYQPHPLCEQAAKELQHHLQTQNEWQHHFGITGDKETAIGKMFGVLLVRNKHNEIGYLAAFSGKLADGNHHSRFVPPVFDMLAEDGFFMAGQAEINKINDQIEGLENDPELLVRITALHNETETATAKIKTHRERMIESRKTRKAKRLAAVSELDTEAYKRLKNQLDNESIQEKSQLKTLTAYWKERVQISQDSLNQLTHIIDGLKNQRKALSAALQQRLFDQYNFLNPDGVEKNLNEIFKETSQLTPPAGAGECAAPKLLQYAFKSDLQPLAMAEFWWGASPKSAVRKHLNYYPACQGKCQPILKHMLKGVVMDESPLLNNPAEGKTIDIVHEDDCMLVINKPAEFLSVPGKSIEDSVYFRIKQSYPNATGPLVVHRLDMSTSGLMLVALSRAAHKDLQQQFIKRTVKKRYVAMLDGLIEEDEGFIDLPLRVDLDDRPRQLVCYEYGKPAKTQWKVIKRYKQQTKIHFYPITGRTHQLRVHAAHVKGLNTPIVGDDLYGNSANRLHLHAEYLEFNHPKTQERMRFQVEPEF
jgi:tRNA pseudouridine32 synthase/23S rRNA pseudouridine746 synthase